MKNTLQIKLAELRKANENKALRIAELERDRRDNSDLISDNLRLKCERDNALQLLTNARQLLNGK